MHRFRRYDDPRSENDNIFNYVTSSNNRDGLAIRTAGYDLLQREEEKKIMSIVNENGETEEVEVILAFEFKDNKKEYVVYTKNETDENGNVTVYVSNVDRSSGEPKLLGIDNESEWDRIKDVLRELSKPEAE